MIATEKKGNSHFSDYHSLGVKLQTRLRLQFSHQREHKFRHGFVDTISLMCGWNAEIEDMEHFLLHFYFYSPQQFKLFNIP